MHAQGPINWYMLGFFLFNNKCIQYFLSQQENHMNSTLQTDVNPASQWYRVRIRHRRVPRPKSCRPRDQEAQKPWLRPNEVKGHNEVVKGQECMWLFEMERRCSVWFRVGKHLWCFVLADWLRYCACALWLHHNGVKGHNDEVIKGQSLWLLSEKTLLL